MDLLTNLSPQRITIDVNEREAFSLLYMKQGDKNTRRVEITLTVDGKVLVVDETVTPYLRASSNGVMRANDIVPDENISEDGSVIVDITSNMLALPGRLKCELALTSNDDRERVLTSGTFYIEVGESVGGEHVHVINVLNGIITSEMISDGSINAKKLSVNSVTSDKLVNGAVTSEKIRSRSVTPDKLDRSYLEEKTGAIANEDLFSSELKLSYFAYSHTYYEELADEPEVDSLVTPGVYHFINSKFIICVTTLSNLAESHLVQFKISADSVEQRYRLSPKSDWEAWEDNRIIREGSINSVELFSDDIRQRFLSMPHYYLSNSDEPLNIDDALSPAIYSCDYPNDKFVLVVLTEGEASGAGVTQIRFTDSDVSIRYLEGSDFPWGEWRSLTAGSNGQISPEFANSLEDCTDTTKLYVLPDGYLYAYMTTTEYPEVTIVEGKDNGYWMWLNDKPTCVDGETAYGVKSNKIPVTPGDKFKYLGDALDTSTHAVSLVWYTSSDTILSHEAYRAETSPVEVTAPSGAAFVEFYSAHYHLNSYEEVPLEITWLEYAGATSMRWTNTGHAFVPADYEDRIVALENKQAEAEAISLLKGKTIVYDGDSICAPSSYNGGGYAKIIADKVGCYVVNEAVGGGRLVTASADTSYSFHSVVDNLENLPTDADLYCFEGGINDFWHNGDLGDFSPYDFTGELDKTTVCGALESIFRYSIDNFLGKPICFIIVHKIPTTVEMTNEKGDTFADYREKMIGICEKYSIPYYDAFAKSGLNGLIETQRNAYLNGTGPEKPDGCHPNEEGYKKYYVPQLISLFESIMPVD